MNSSLFESMAKAAVAALCAKAFDESYEDDDIQLVWFAHTLGDKKAILIDGGKNSRIYEVTYNKARDEMYVDCYEKAFKTILNGVTDIVRDMME